MISVDIQPETDEQRHLVQLAAEFHGWRAELTTDEVVQDGDSTYLRTIPNPRSAQQYLQDVLSARAVEIFTVAHQRRTATLAEEEAGQQTQEEASP